jgi:outer membrane protein, multidrug efflux system
MPAKFLSQKFLYCCLLILTSCSLTQRYPKAECVQNCMSIWRCGWQDFFNDPALKRLIFSALNNNRDLRVAVQRMDEAMALCGLQRAEQCPTGDSTIASHVSWEIDFWRHLRSLKGSGLENYLATTETQDATFISLIGQVANTYLIETELNELICVTMKTIAVRQESYRIMKLRLEEGAASKFDFLQAEAFLQEAMAELTALELRRALNWNAMTLLVGIPICPDDNLLSQIEPYFIKEICPDVPSELLCNRPDVRAAKHKLLAAKANARRNLAVIEYERTIQVAFREVADALAEHAWLAEQVLIQKELLAAQTERARIAWIRFQCSTSGFLEVLDAEQDIFSAEKAFVQTQRSLLASGVNLYIALGGGNYR